MKQLYEGAFKTTDLSTKESIKSFFILKNIVFPAQADYPCFSAEVRLKIFLWLFPDYSVSRVSIIKSVCCLDLYQNIQPLLVLIVLLASFTFMRKEDCNTVHFSTCDCLVRTNFNPQKFQSFQSLSLGFILKILVKFTALIFF